MTCAVCDKILRDAAPSVDFCGPVCQALWQRHAQSAVPLLDDGNPVRARWVLAGDESVWSSTSSSG